MKRIAYHGTNARFTKPNFDMVGENTDDIVFSNFGFYTTDNEQYAMDYAKYRAQYYGGEPVILKFRITIDNPYCIQEGELAEICQDEESAAEFKAQLIEEGFDGLEICIPGKATEYCCFYPQQVTSPEGESNDNTGNV